MTDNHPHQMSDQTPTPRTDARLPKCTLEAKVVSADFARQLERELADAIAERDQLRAEVQALREVCHCQRP